jgi:hypothetical protein
VGQGRGRAALDENRTIGCFHYKNGDGVFQFEEKEVESVYIGHVGKLKSGREDNGFGRWSSCRIICNFAGLNQFVP